MAGVVPVLYWSDRFENRLGIMSTLGELVHTEELNGEDVIEFMTMEAPIKGDRLLWKDDSGTWHEHIVVRTEDAGRGVVEVYAENSVCELLNDFIEDKRMRGYTAAAAVANALLPTRWTARSIGDLGTATAVFYHTNALAALHLVCDTWGGELTAGVDVAGNAVTARWVTIAAQRGAWYGARLTYGKNLSGCTKTVLDDEVYTALYGYGAGLPVLDDEGEWTGGYRRKLTFGDINGGLNYVVDADALQVWGRWNADKSAKVHSFGQVCFSSCTDKEELLALTTAALAEACHPKVTYDADVALLPGGVPIALGDTVAVIDTERTPEWRLQLRALRMVHTYGDAVRERVVLGCLEGSLYSAMDELTGRMGDNEENAGYAGDKASGGNGAIGGIQEDIDEIQDDIGVIQEDIDDLKEDNDQNKQDIDDLKEGQKTGDEELTEIERYLLELFRGGTYLPIAYLLDNGTFEIKYANTYGSSRGTIVNAWVIKKAGYMGEQLPPWVDIADQVTHAVIDASFLNSGFKRAQRWFYGMSSLVDVTGFENLQNCTQLNGLFMGCERLETVYATSFDNTNVNAVTGMFSGCAALVSAGNRAGAWVSGGTKEMLAVGEDGYLIAPGQDPRVRMYWYAYENGSKYDLEVTLTQGADPLRTLAHEGSCFAGVGYTFSYLRQPWYAIADKIANVDLDASLAAYDGMHVENWFWECEAIESITGIANLRGVESLSGTFAFRHATPMTVVDLRGFDASAVTNCSAAFIYDSSITTILVDAGFVLGDCSMSFSSSAFLGCTSLVGGAGTTYDAENTGWQMFRIDGGPESETPGYCAVG